jgi:hypothetical protein
MSLYDMSRRSRYDMGRLSVSLGNDETAALNLLIGQWQNIKDFCKRRKSSQTH